MARLQFKACAISDLSLLTRHNATVGARRNVLSYLFRVQRSRAARRTLTQGGRTLTSANSVLVCDTDGCLACSCARHGTARLTARRQIPMSYFEEIARVTTCEHSCLYQMSWNGPPARGNDMTHSSFIETRRLPPVAKAIFGWRTILRFLFAGHPRRSGEPFFRGRCGPIRMSL